MRKIKFRGKGIADNEWYFGDLIQTRLGTTWIITEDYTTATEEISLNTCASPQVKAETVGRYTGLHDKNGKEIYEGDIVLIDAYTYEGPEFSREYLVKYNELLGMWTLINLENYDKEEFITFEDLNGWYRLDIELLGNKYENKELLTK